MTQSTYSPSSGDSPRHQVAAHVLSGVPFGSVYGNYCAPDVVTSGAQHLPGSQRQAVAWSYVGEVESFRVVLKGGA